MTAAKKNFSTMNTNSVFEAIEAATAEAEEETATPAAGEHTRRTYSEEEAKEFLNSLKTAGRKGVKLPRINMAFTPELYDYIRTMSKVSGITLTEFVNTVIKQYMEEHREQYDKAIEFRNSL